MHVMELPRRVIVGEGILSDLGTILEDLEIGKRILAISGPNVAALLEGTVEGALETRFELSWKTIQRSTTGVVDEISQLAKGCNATCLLGIGGGKSIDVAKLSSFNNKIPFVSVPTSASHDGISSPFASVKGLDRPYSFVAKPPIAIVADTIVISQAPPELLRSGCGDLISKKTAVKDWALAHEKRGEYYGNYSASLALLSADIISGAAKEIHRGAPESIRVVVEALISSGVAAGIAGSSRPCSGSEHLFSHAMDIVAPGKGMHGEKCGIGTIMMAKLHGIDFWKISDSLQTIGAPTTAKEIGASESDVARSLVMAKDIRTERYTILDEVHLDETRALDLARSVNVL
jgi:glycerol-1-phosphate dehydrogenase [NAD(P)+]